MTLTYTRQEKYAEIDGHRYPEMLKRVLRGLPPRPVKKFLLFFTSYLARFRFLRRAVGAHNLNEHTEALLDESVALADRPDLDDYLDAYMETARTAHNVSYHDRLGDISKPTLIVLGQNDPAISLKFGQEVR